MTNPFDFIPNIAKTEALRFEEIKQRPPDVTAPFRPVAPGSNEYESAAPGIERFTFVHDEDLPPIATESNYWFVHNSLDLLVGFWENSAGTFPPHYHPVIAHWTVITEGTVHIVTDEQAIKLGPGDFLHLEPLRPHAPLVLPEQGHVSGIEICIPGNNYETIPLLEGESYEKVANNIREVVSNR